MKYYFCLFFVIISSYCFSQLTTEKFYGEWQYKYTSDYHDSIVDSGVKDFILKLDTSGEFQMRGGEVLVNGNWSFSDSTLVLNGISNNAEEYKVQKLIIYTISESQMQIRTTLEIGGVLLNLKRIN